MTTPDADASSIAVVGPELASRSSRRAQNLLAWLMLLAICTLWLLNLKLPFSVVDDPYFITANKYTNEGLCWDSIKWAFTTDYGDYWHPLMWLSLLLDDTLFGMVPWGFHLTNALLHVANAALVFILLKRIWGGTWKSWLGAALFAIHPQRVESVAWATERKDVLAGFFGLLALCAYLRFVQRRNTGWYLATCAALFASLISKPMLLTFPFLLLLLDWLALGRLSRERLWPLLKEKIPFFLLGADEAVNVYLHGLTHGFYQGSLSSCLQNTVMNFAGYLWQFFYPVRLVLYPKALGWIPWWRIAAAELLLVAIFALAFIAWRRNWPGRQALLFGWLWFLVCMLPMSGILQPGYSMRGDRFTYIPCIGLIVALLWGVAPLLPPLRRPRLSAVAAGAMLAALAALTINRMILWQDNLRLYEHDLALDEGNAWLHHWAGWAAREDNLPALARYHETQASSLDPDSFFERGLRPPTLPPGTPLITAAPPR